MERKARRLTPGIAGNGMARRRVIPGRARMALAGLAAGLVLLASCTETTEGDRFVTRMLRVANSQQNPVIEAAEQTVEFTLAQPSRALVNAPDALLVLERDLGRAFEQRIVLPNATAVRGDNVLHIRAQTDDSVRLTEFNFDEIITRFGGLPAPFERLDRNMMMSGQDALGSFVYARETLGTSTVCVLALRRLTVGARPLPRGTQALDVMMRNCVIGSAELALAPVGERALAVGSAGQRMLSAHAAPQR